MATVPNVVGEFIAQATIDIQAAGLVVGVVTQAYDPAVPVGAVISQSPVGGTPIGPSANLIIRSTAGSAISDVAAGGDPVDQILGDFATLIGQAPGLYFSLFDSGPDFVMRAFSGIAQFDFTSIAMVDVGQTFTSASAAFSAGCGTNSWTWAGRAIGVAPATVYNMLVTP